MGDHARPSGQRGRRPSPISALWTKVSPAEVPPVERLRPALAPFVDRRGWQLGTVDHESSAYLALQSATAGGRSTRHKKQVRVCGPTVRGHRDVDWAAHRLGLPTSSKGGRVDGRVRTTCSAVSRLASPSRPSADSHQQAPIPCDWRNVGTVHSELAASGWRPRRLRACGRRRTSLSRVGAAQVRRSSRYCMLCCQSGRSSGLPE